MNKIVAHIIAFAILLCFVAPVLAAVTIPDPLNGQTFPGLLCKIADGVGTLIATLGTIMIIVAGIFYLISAGNPQKMETAKKALIYAIVGIVIGIAAKAIVGIVGGIIGASGGTTCQ